MKIDAFDARIAVRGHLDEGERQVVTAIAGYDFLAADFEFWLTPARDGWQTRHVKVTGGKLKKDRTPSRVMGSHTYWLSEESTPQWVHDIVEYARPDARAPRPRAHQEQ